MDRYDERWFMIWQGRVAPPVGVTGCAKARAMAEPTFTLRQLNAYNVIATLAAKRGRPAVINDRNSSSKRQPAEKADLTENFTPTSR